MEIIKLNLIPTGVNPTCHCSQYDEGRVIRIELFDGLTPYTLQSGDTVTLNVRKPDNTIVTTSVTATQGNKYVDIVTTEQICAVVGYNLCDLTITNGSVVIGTLNFIMQIERDVLADGIPSQSVIEDLDALVQEAVGDNYYTKTEVDSALNLKADKSTTYTKTEVDSALALKANASDVYTKSQTDSALALKANSADVYTKSQVYTKTETDSALALKANSADVYTKTEVYTKSETDSALALKANAADVYTKTQVDTALTDKADIDGSYDNMTVGNAKQLVSSVFTEDQVPYNFRTSGGSADIGNRENDTVIGGTVAFNQLVKNGNFIDTSNWSKNSTASWSVASNVMSLTTNVESANNRIYQDIGVATNHKIIILADIKASTEVDAFIGLTATGSLSGTTSNISATTTWSRYGVIVDTTNGSNITIGRQGTTTDPIVFDITNVVAIDLTQMFGSTIADYIYSLEQGTAGAGVAWFKSLFPKPYYAYNAGELMSVKTSAHVTTGFNQFDEVTELGSFDINGNPIASTTSIRSKNFIPVLPDTAYYFQFDNTNSAKLYILQYDKNYNFIAYLPAATGITAPSIRITAANCYYLKIDFSSAYGTAYKNDTCINLSWSGYRNGEYEPYVKNTYALDSDLELRGIPKLDADNKLYYDGDKYESDGTVTRRYGIVDLGSLNWSYSNTRFNVAFAQAKLPPNTSTAFNGLCGEIYNVSPSLSLADKGICITSGGLLRVYDSDYTDATTFKTAMSGVYLVYELATSTTEQADAYQDPQIVDDFGTEEYVDTRAVQIPVGHDTKYPVNLRDKLQHLPSLASSNGVYHIQQTDNQMSLVADTSDGRLTALEAKIPTPPTTDGTYRLTVTVSGGVATYAWVSV